MWRFAIDTGGTFTDVIGTAPDGSEHRDKVLSSATVRSRLARVDGHRLTLETDRILADDVLAGCRVGEATVLSSSGAELVLDRPCALQAGALVAVASSEEAPVFAMRLMTGCPPGRELPVAELRLGTTRATNALLEGDHPEVGLVLTAGFGDLLRIGDQRRPDLFAAGIVLPDPLTFRTTTLRGRIDLKGRESQPLETAPLTPVLESWLADGIEDVAVCLMHADVDGRHERVVAGQFRDLGFRRVTVSSDVDPRAGYLRRARTTVTHAALRPVMESYLDGIRGSMPGARLLVMTSAGDLVPSSLFAAHEGLLSGPAGGVVGALAAGRAAGFDNLLSFDMGGTSTDVARVDGQVPSVEVHRVGDGEVASRAVDVETVAAGGGSVCWFDGHRLRVGPKSAGAEPGPASYGGGGPLTVTDCNVLSGRLPSEGFPWPLDVQAAEDRLSEIGQELQHAGVGLDRSEILEGFLEIVNESMAGAVARVTRRQGRDPADYTLVAFGGAGAQHACELAALLGMTHVLIPEDGDILSARGIAAADVVRRSTRQYLESWPAFSTRLADETSRITGELLSDCTDEGLAGAERLATRIRLRVRGHDATLEVDVGNPVGAFNAEYARRYGRRVRTDDLEVVDLTVSVGVRRQAASQGGAVPEAGIVLPPDWIAREVPAAGRVLEKRRGTTRVRRHGDAIDLELFAQRFTSIARDMGVTLQATTTSTSIRERGDFSCAVLDRRGRLVVNAPHIPVHLGALGVCVRSVLERDWREGDALVTNHPGFGGSHLPDVTVISPVTVEGEIVGFVASRAHHAEIGGQAPGSMPADGRCLEDEGVVISPTWLCRDGREEWNAMRDLFSTGAHPSRDPEANLADLRAQLQANRRGVTAMTDLCREFGVEQVSHWMSALERQAADVLHSVFLERPMSERHVRTVFDDAGVLSCDLLVDRGRARIRLRSDPETCHGNLNAPEAVVISTVVYVLRLLCGREIPLNEGLLEHVDLDVGPGRLAPRFSGEASTDPAVVGGNVETSQRLADLLLEAFAEAAHSQGTMNNLLIGNDRFTSYETLGGGSGATLDTDGADAVQVHMTNTAITDPEILERRHPLRVEEFSIRTGSGGDGRRKGGCGLVRTIRCLEPVTVSLLAERRAEGPSGLDGGGAGLPGTQCLIHPDGREEPMPGRFTRPVEAGTMIRIETPGGGGVGSAG